MSYYDVGSTNNNRLVRFRVQGHGGSAAANIFGVRHGPSAFYPQVGRNRAPTNNQLLAQLRTSLVVRRLTAYVPAAHVEVAADTSSNAAGALIIAFEVDQMGVFFNNLWFGNTSLAKHLTTDIVDGVGTGGMTTVKTKPGLATLLGQLATVSYDGGTTGPFAALSTTGAIVLPTTAGYNGGTTSGAPSLATGAGAGFESGLEIIAA